MRKEPKVGRWERKKVPRKRVPSDLVIGFAEVVGRMRVRSTKRQDTKKGGRANMTVYEIRVRGHLDGRWSVWFDELKVTNLENGETLLSGNIVDQAALHGVLIKVRDLGLPLIAVTSVGPDRQEPSNQPAPQ